MKSFEKIGGKILAGILSFAALVSPLSPAADAMDTLDAKYELFCAITPGELAGIHGVRNVKGKNVHWVFDFDKCTLTMNRMTSVSFLRKCFEELASNDHEQQECRSILGSIPDDINARLHCTINYDGVVTIVVDAPISKSIVLHSNKPLCKRELWGTFKLYEYLVDSGMISSLPGLSL